MGMEGSQNDLLLDTTPPWNQIGFQRSKGSLSFCFIGQFWKLIDDHQCKTW